MSTLTKEEVEKYLLDMQALTGTSNRLAIQEQKDELAKTPHQVTLEEQRAAIVTFNKLSDRAFEYIKAMGLLEKAS